MFFCRKEERPNNLSKNWYKAIIHSSRVLAMRLIPWFLELSQVAQKGEVLMVKVKAIKCGGAPHPNNFNTGQNIQQGVG